ncbi:MAG: hypothetical protein Q7P63_12245 [Verrucomicrobiota bacterium JB022]|nr:hypothetical protein [Verrucomicrobiota bacterium JB022]
MKLSEYLILNRIAPASFAKQVGLRSRTSIHRYLSGERFPNPEVMARITTSTGGTVTAEDFQYPLPDNDNDADYPWSREWQEELRRCDHVFRQMLREKAEWDTLSPPVRRAVNILGNRVQMDVSERHFRLDGRPAGARDIVRLANRFLSESGLETIKYPGVG